MGVQSVDSVQVEVNKVASTDKRPSNSDSNGAVSPIDEDFAKGYVDPKEERAFVSD